MTDVLTARTESTGVDAAPSVLIVGGGLAGIAAAVQLARQGVAVTLVETRKRLGGRATSFTDPSTGQLLDNCQHVLLGCCTNLIDLYAKLGVADAIAWHRRLYFVGPAARSSRSASNGDDAASPWVIDELEATDLPAPLHMTQPLMRFQTLSLAEKLAIARGMMAVMRLGRSGRDASDDVSFLDWLKKNHQSDAAIEKFWAVISISALNELPQRSSTRYALQVFQDGFLANEQAYTMGLASVPLVALYDSAQDAIEAAGGSLMLGAGAEQFLYENGRVIGLRLSDGHVLRADAYVSAVPFDRLHKLCEPAMQQDDARLQHLDRFTVSPIIGVHLWFDRAVTDLPHLIFMKSPLQWLFNKGMEPPQRYGLPEQANGQPVQHVHGVISAAHALVDRSADDITQLVVREVCKALPDAAKATLLHARVVKEKRATFSVEPGTDRYRPQATGTIGNLYLAGDWCDTGWPATMEGAVRSGYTAAAALLERLNRAAMPLIPDLDAAPLYQLLANR